MGYIQSMGSQKSQTKLSSETASRSNKHRNRQCTIIDRCAGARPDERQGSSEQEGVKDCRR